MSEWENMHITGPPIPGSSAPSWWLQAIVALGALLMGLGALFALFDPTMLVSPGAVINEAVRVYAGYFAARNLALAVVLLVSLGLRARQMLNMMMLLAGFIQLLDASLDLIEGRWVILPGVAVLGVILLIGSARISGSPFWKIGAWKQDS
jgi:hypothetical protein